MKLISDSLNTSSLLDFIQYKFIYFSLQSFATCEDLFFRNPKAQSDNWANLNRKIRSRWREEDFSDSFTDRKGEDLTGLEQEPYFRGKLALTCQILSKMEIVYYKWINSL